jgi:hypothetical protein
LSIIFVQLATCWALIYIEGFGIEANRFFDSGIFKTILRENHSWNATERTGMERHGMERNGPVRSRTKRSGLRGMFATIGSLSFLTSIIAFPASALAQDSLSLAADLNGDGVPEIIIGSQSQGGQLGQLTVFDGLTSTTIVRFQGESPADGFGSVALVIPDASGDGESELLVAAPNAIGGAGALYLFHSPWISPCTDLVSAAHADVVVRVPSADPVVHDFGGMLRLMFDVDSDGFGEVQVSARTMDAQGRASVRMYIFSPSRGEVLVQFDPIVATASVPEVSGDTNGDAEVTTADLLVILENFAIPVPTRRSGDLDGDGVVGLTDLTEVITEFGRRGYEAIMPPPNAAGAVLCDLGTAGLAWVTPRASAKLRLRIVATPGSEEVAIETLPVPGYFPPDFYPLGNVWMLFGCVSDARVQQVLRRIVQSCPLNGPIFVNFCACGPHGTIQGASGATRFSCLSDIGRAIEVMVCENAEDPCGVFAHELIHVVQYCEYGAFAGAHSCSTINAMLDDPRDHLCRELEAHQFFGACDGDPATDHATCCEILCILQAKYWGWRGDGCPNSCVDCCMNWGEACCVAGRWSCPESTICPMFPN